MAAARTPENKSRVRVVEGTKGKGTVCNGIQIPKAEIGRLRSLVDTRTARRTPIANVEHADALRPRSGNVRPSTRTPEHGKSFYTLCGLTGLAGPRAQNDTEGSTVAGAAVGATTGEGACRHHQWQPRSIQKQEGGTQGRKGALRL